MRGFSVFVKKELIEQLRTYKLFIICTVFFLFGMSSPLLAKLMPEIFKNMKVEGMKIIIPEPTALDAYGQFFKNMSQMGLIIILLVFGSIISNELMRGTLINILAKGLPRTTVIISKYAAAIILWTISYTISAATAIGYTFYLFDPTGISNLILSFFCLWLFGCFVIALIFLSSTVTTGNFGGLILSAVTLMLLLIMNSLPKVGRFNPITLASKNLSLLDGSLGAGELIITIIITSALIILCLYISILLFGKKKL